MHQPAALGAFLALVLVCGCESQVDYGSSGDPDPTDAGTDATEASPGEAGALDVAIDAVPSDAVSSDAVSSDAVSSDAVSSDAVSSDAVSSDTGPPAPDATPGDATAPLPDTVSPADAANPALPAEQYPYDPSSFAFNQKIPSGMGDDPRNAAITARLDELTSTNKVGLSADGEVPPVYVVGPGDPLYSVTVDGEPTSFRVPQGTIPGSGADYPLILLDPQHPDHGPFTELRLWQASVNNSSKTLTANGAGLFHYNNNGALLNPDGTPSISVPFLGGGTGSGLSYLAGLIRPDEVKKGVIAHALRFNYSACHSTDQHRPPATKTDQPNGCSTEDPPSAMDMGMRLQLVPSVDCDARTVPGKTNSSKETRFLRIICRALQDYGMIMTDGTGPGGLLLMMEHKTTADWQSIVGAELWGSYGYLLRDQDTPDDGQQRGPSDGIPWHQLRVLKKSVF